MQKTDSDWGYAWIPVVGLILGGIFGALLFKLIIGMQFLCNNNEFKV